MPGCRKFDAAARPPIPPRRVELRRYIRPGARPPRAANDNRRASALRGWYWAVVVGAMPTLATLGLIAALATLL